jgi:ribosomal-protein-alanine N-acetyltransferase
MTLMQDAIIRQANLHDLNSLVAFENASFSSDRMSRSSFLHALTHTTSKIIIAELNGEVIGSAAIFFRKNSKRARLYSIAVHPDYQGKGVSNALYATIEQLIIKHQCNELRLEVRIDNPRAIQFYKKHSYEIFGTIHQFYEDGTDALRMKKILL